jgi:hypothetical protein
VQDGNDSSGVIIPVSLTVILVTGRWTFSTVSSWTVQIGSLIWTDLASESATHYVADIPEGRI